MTISRYDNCALKEIQDWKNPKISWLEKTLQIINSPLNKASDLVLTTPAVGDVIKASIQGLTDVCNDVAQWSVRKETIYNEFRIAGFSEIKKESDVFDLELKDVDKVTGWLDAKYKGIALAEGAGTGALGLPGIPIDLAALISLNLRAIGEYATYYGFNIQLQQERLYAMNVLGWASSPTDASKTLTMSHLARIAQDVAQKRSWKELEKHTFVQIIQQIAKALGIRLTKAKLAQIVPIAGAAIGGGFNSYFTAKVCKTAYHLYRERFLAQKYGVDIIEVSAEQTIDIYPNYPE